MFPSYLAGLHDGRLQWLGPEPDTSEPITVLVTLLGEDAPRLTSFSPERYTYRAHLDGPDDAVAWFVEDLSGREHFLSAVQENVVSWGIDAKREFKVVRVVLARAAAWSWSQLASGNSLTLVGLEVL